jgi:hypothetical protein
VAPEDRWCRLVERVEGGAPAAPAEPVFAEGRRWPKPPAARTRTIFRLAVSYWRTGSDQPGLTADQARTMRRKSEAAALDATQLRALAQQPLDVGLFESPAPEAPHILIPDE